MGGGGGGGGSGPGYDTVTLDVNNPLFGKRNSNSGVVEENKTFSQRFILDTVGRQKEWDAFAATKEGVDFFNKRGQSRFVKDSEQFIPKGITYSVVEKPHADETRTREGAISNSQTVKGIDQAKGGVTSGGGNAAASTKGQSQGASTPSSILGGSSQRLLDGVKTLLGM